MPSLRPCGDRAILIDVADTAAARAWAEAVRQSDLPVTDVVGGAASVLVVTTPERLPVVAAGLRTLTPAAPELAGLGPVVIDTTYDGPDLSSAAASLGMSTEALVAAHTRAGWRVSFSGFAPGFAYLTCDDARFDTPRLASPRTKVPAGSVGLAGPYTGVYPRESPGGWQLIGRTDVVLWDVHREPSPALLTPDTRVQFRELRT